MTVAVDGGGRGSAAHVSRYPPDGFYNGRDETMAPDTWNLVGPVPAVRPILGPG